MMRKDFSVTTSWEVFVAAAEMTEDSEGTSCCANRAFSVPPGNDQENVGVPC